MLKRIITEDEADWSILKLANEKKKFAIEVGFSLSEEEQYALERGQDREWFTLVDVTWVSHGPPGVLMRVFKLTTKGLQRRNDLLPRNFGAKEDGSGRE